MQDYQDRVDGVKKRKDLSEIPVDRSQMRRNQSVTLKVNGVCKCHKGNNSFLSQITSMAKKKINK